MTLQAIDVYPTHHEQGYDLRVGRPFPFGATTVPGGVNFSVFSSAATSCTLVLFDKGCPQPKAEILFPDGFRIGHTWAMTVFNLDVETMEYGYRMDGPWNPEQGHRFDSTKILLDPYARAIGGRDVWGAAPDWNNVFPHRGRVVFEDFDWEGDRPLETPIEDLVVYEAHARGLTRDPSSGVKFPGSFGGIREKIPYLKELGINCLELLPIFEFDEFENSRTHAETGELLLNFWGYSTVGFFAPKTGYAATGQVRHAGRRAEGPGQGAPQERHRDLSRRRVQPHRRRQREGPVHLVPRPRQSHLLHADARGVLLQLQRDREHAQLQQPGRPQHGSGLPALLGRRVPHRRLPLRPGGHSRARSVRRPAAQSTPARITRLRPDSGQVQAHRRSLGRGRPVPGRAASPRTAAGASGTASTAIPFGAFSKATRAW